MSEHCVYIYKDIDGNDLYAGQTSDRASRDKQHKHSSPWYEDVRTVKYLECESLGDSLILEAKVINKLKPKHNRMIPSISNVISRVLKRMEVENADRLNPVSECEGFEYYDLEAYIIFNYGSVYAAPKATGSTDTQLRRWIKAGALIDKDGNVWIKSKGRLPVNGEQVLVVRLTGQTTKQN